MDSAKWSVDRRSGARAPLARGMGGVLAASVVLLLSLPSCGGGGGEGGGTPGPEPTAAFSVSPTLGTRATVFTFNASLSSDPQDSTVDLEVRWDWESDGSFDTDWSSIKTASHVYDTVGERTVTVEVRDSTDLTDIATQVVTVITGVSGQLLFLGGVGTLYPYMCLISADGSGLSSLWGALLAWAPVWAPDGSRIAFCDPEPGDIWVINPDWSGKTNLTNGSTSAQDLAWSPDGGRIAFRSPSGADWDLWLMNPDGSEQQVLVEAAATELGEPPPAWSPDGSRIAFTSDRDGNWEIYSVNVEGSDLTNLTRNSARDREPAWSPDGARIAFTSDRGGDNEIWVMNGDGTGQVELTHNGVPDFGPVWSPDGALVAFTREPASYFSQVCVMGPDGSGQAALTPSSMTARSPQWSPDGTAVAFLVGGDIWVMNADGSEAVNVTQGSVAYVRCPPLWRPGVQ